MKILFQGRVSPYPVNKVDEWRKQESKCAYLQSNVNDQIHNKRSSQTAMFRNRKLIDRNIQLSSRLCSFAMKIFKRNQSLKASENKQISGVDYPDPLKLKQ